MLAQSGRVTVADLCEQFGISRKTGYKHLARSAESPLLSNARAAQTPYDPDRIELFTKLAGALNGEVLPRLAEPALSTNGWRARAFFEAYFSN